MEIVKLNHDRQLPGEVNEALVDALERLLDRAKSGELTALAWVGALRDDSAITGWEGSGGTTFPLGAGILALQYRFGQFIHEGD